MSDKDETRRVYRTDELPDDIVEGLKDELKKREDIEAEELKDADQPSGKPAE
jgi:hypothetical protein